MSTGRPGTDPPDAEGAALSVLIVEDNVDGADSLAELLQLHRFRVAVAGNGREALATAATHWPEVVLLDLGLPDMTGWDVARQLRSAAAGRGLLIVAVTGLSQASDREQSAAAGIDLHLIKPVDPADLVAFLDRHVRAGRSDPPT